MTIKEAVDCLKKDIGCKSMGIGCDIDTIEECRKCNHYVSDAELDEALNEIINYFDKFGSSLMTVKDVVSLLQYGVDFEIKGSFSGKIYHDSCRHREEHLEKYLDMEVSAEPLYSKLSIDRDSLYCSPTIGIWMRDYDLCIEKEKKR